MSERPTDAAHRLFKSAGRTANLSITMAPHEVGKSGLSQVFSSLADIADGLDNVATALRAIYIKLEQIEAAQRGSVKPVPVQIPVPIPVRKP